MNGPETTSWPRLLGRLPAGDLTAVARDLVRVTLEERQLLVRAHEPVRRVYFPMSGLLAVSVAMHDGRVAGVTLVGSEGVVGLEAGASLPAVTEAAVQVRGEALAMPAPRFRAAMRDHEAFRITIERYTFGLLSHIAQSAACNQLHNVRERAARWLLLAYDRNGDSIPITQQDFADLLGVSRPVISTVGARLAREGIAEFRRGSVAILDAVRLEAVSCDCLLTDREAFRLVMAPGSGAEFAPDEHHRGRAPFGIMRTMRRAR
jgi:CRP-like cAMP-binding protein